LGHHHLSDADPPAFSAGDAPDKVVAHLGVVGVGETKHGHDDAGRVATELGARHALDSIGRGAHGGGELNCLADGEVGKVLVHLLVVDDLSFELLDHLLLRDAIVTDDGVLVEVQAVELSADGLEQGRTP